MKLTLTPLLSLCGLLALLPNCGGGNCCYKSAPSCPTETVYQPTAAQAGDIVIEQASPTIIESASVSAAAPAIEIDEEEFEELDQPAAEPVKEESTSAVADKDEDDFVEETTETK